MLHMAIHYRCRHCETEVGLLPFDSEESVRKLHQLNEAEAEQYIHKDHNGDTTVDCICEHCEESLKQFPDYYALKKWLQ